MKPILFNTEMVQALLGGRKTVTRRLVKNLAIHHEHIEKSVNGPYERYELYDVVNGEEEYDCWFSGEIKNIAKDKCILNYAKYKVGDILYVRETFCSNYFDECIARQRKGNRNAYKADYNKNMVGDVVPEPKWTPSIHMPKKAARIFLKITDVSVERLQNMKISDIEKEGFSRGHSINETRYDRGRKDFEELWNSTVKEDWQKFDANPWVWAYEFEQCEKPESL